MKIQSQIKFILCLAVLSGCSKSLIPGGGGRGNIKTGDCGAPTPHFPGSCPTADENIYNTFPTEASIQSQLNTDILYVYNACKNFNGTSNPDMWLATDKLNSGLTVDRYNPVKVQYGHLTSVASSGALLASMRFWAKYGCDSIGQNCQLGQEIPPNSSTLSCFDNNQFGCQGTFDTGFEIDNSGTAAFYDVTLVNGFSGPLKVYVFGGGAPDSTYNCSSFGTPGNLSISALCPTNEILNTPRSGWASQACTLVQTTGLNLIFGDYNKPYINSYGEEIDLDTPRALAVKNYYGNQLSQNIGCYAPGTILSSPREWGGLYVAQCSGTQCNPNNQPPDIDSKITNGQTPQAAAYDSRLVMYTNPYSACDLTNGTVGDNNNCLNNSKTPIQQKNPPFAQPNAFENNLVNFCTSGNNATASPYCSDKVAATANTVNNPLQRGSTAASNLGRLGPIVKTKYVNYVHDCIPDTYAWQYDDDNALRKCLKADSGSGVLKIVMVFGCPVP